MVETLCSLGSTVERVETRTESGNEHFARQESGLSQ